MLQIPDEKVAAILDLADFFEDLDPALYDQGTFKAGDRRCICGWCNHRTNHIESDTIAAARTLGISEQQKNQLFAGNAGHRRDGNWIWNLDEAPGPKDAARALRHLAVTGEMPADW